MQAERIAFLVSLLTSTKGAEGRGFHWDKSLTMEHLPELRGSDELSMSHIIILHLTGDISKIMPSLSRIIRCLWYVIIASPC